MSVNIEELYVSNQDFETAIETFKLMHVVLESRISGGEADLTDADPDSLLSKKKDGRLLGYLNLLKERGERSQDVTLDKFYQEQVQQITDDVHSARKEKQHLQLKRDRLDKLYANTNSHVVHLVILPKTSIDEVKKLKAFLDYHTKWDDIQLLKEEIIQKLDTLLETLKERERGNNDIKVPKICIPITELELQRWCALHVERLFLERNASKEALSEVQALFSSENTKLKPIEAQRVLSLCQNINQIMQDNTAIKTKKEKIQKACHDTIKEAKAVSHGFRGIINTITKIFGIGPIFIKKSKETADTRILSQLKTKLSFFTKSTGQKQLPPQGKKSKKEHRGKGPFSILMKGGL